MFDGDEGETVRIELASRDFDTYFGLVTPSGEEIANDDFDGDAERSVIEMTLPEAGRYRVSSDVVRGRRDRPLPPRTDDEQPDSPGRAPLAGPRLRRYSPASATTSGRDTDLQYTAEDATRIRDALIGGGGDARAGRLHVRRRRRHASAT